ncbi:hypothetical protein DV704_08585 [Meiothermus sp. QL-1]|uniref:hypothetical protein n=1 Tax=Meiothermus sp. QL-1 TaxID=2058095 RepID=UPI000E0C0456|nr:hypothetical protein [Meiothermus sp. QL-1]RDI95120.1 hypothetical protein DV704_08585 [Meiothermus sp. QL-1]
MKTKLIWIPLLLGLALAQPTPQTPTMPFEQHRTWRLTQQAAQEVAKAQAARAYLQNLNLAQRPEWLAQADALLSQAQSEMQSGNLFAARERADAAKKVYEAALRLNYVWMPTKRGPRAGWEYSEIYRAQDRIGRLEAELGYYRNNNPAVQSLLMAARTLQSTRPDVARKLADAGLDVIRADRGF